MTRLHRTLLRRAYSINATKTANRAEEYLNAYNEHKSQIKGVSGIATSKRIKKLIRNIDAFEQQIIRAENQVERLKTRRRVEAAKLEEELETSLSILREHLSWGELRQFKG